MISTRQTTHALSILAALALSDLVPVSAQTACVTPSCAFAGTPFQCQNRAAPRTPTILMTTSGPNFVFSPQDPKLEPGDCIVWRAATVAHSSSGNLCPDDPTCAAPFPPTCQWDSGNVNSLSGNPTATCYYDPALFPAAAANPYFCRIHATPTTGTMRGTLRMTTPIVLLADKDLGSSSVKLSWTGGGVTGDISYKVARQSGGDPTFPAGSTNTVNPDGGVTGTTFTDAGDLLNATSRYYLVRNRQTNE